MIAIMVEYGPMENQAGGFFFRITVTVSFANSAEEIDLGPCEKLALARITSSNRLYSFHSGIRL